MSTQNLSPALQVWSHVFCRNFDPLPARVRMAVVEKIDDLGSRLAYFPHARLTGRSECRLRVGDYRVLYEFDSSVGRLYLLYVGHRREIYNRA